MTVSDIRLRTAGSAGPNRLPRAAGVTVVKAQCYSGLADGVTVAKVRCYGDLADWCYGGPADDVTVICTPASDEVEDD